MVRLKRVTAVIAVILLTAVLMAGCGGAKTEAPKNDITPAQNEQSQSLPTEQNNSGSGNDGSVDQGSTTGKTMKLKLYFGNSNADKVVAEEREVPVPADKAVAKLIINELLKGPQNKDLHNAIPEGAKLLSIRIDKGVAYVDFSKEIQTRHPGGTAGESMTVFSIVNSLTELPEIKSVQFLLEGKVVDSIWGHGITDEPIERNAGMIGK